MTYDGNYHGSSHLFHILIKITHCVCPTAAFLQAEDLTDEVWDFIFLNGPGCLWTHVNGDINPFSHWKINGWNPAKWRFGSDDVLFQLDDF